MLKYAALSKFRLTSRILWFCQCVKKKSQLLLCIFGTNGRTWTLFLRVEFFFPSDKLFVTLKPDSLLSCLLGMNSNCKNVFINHFIITENLLQNVLLLIYMCMYFKDVLHIYSWNCVSKYFGKISCLFGEKILCNENCTTFT